MGVEKIEDLPKYKELREKELVSEQIIKNGEEEAPLEKEAEKDGKNNSKEEDFEKKDEVCDENNLENNQ